MKKLYLLFIPFLILGMVACSDKSSQTNGEKNTDAKQTTKQTEEINIDQDFLNDVVNFRDDIKNAMDDLVLYDTWKDVGSLSDKEYEEKIESFFDKWSTDKIDGNAEEARIVDICNDLILKYLEYVKDSLAGQKDKADYALDIFKSDLNQLDSIIQKYN
ncbi:hypothetical protein [Caenibacillus caldisaponilyticus]|uniref:hypothetical protein n=1 Tax=Caenibacillus caldisaponilyticus TaxID=1674942 RepID=UPI000988898B|nr:hypothetical protein [Caenibacillus caldisaponilyticus]